MNNGLSAEKENIKSSRKRFLNLRMAFEIL